MSETLTEPTTEERPKPDAADRKPRAVAAPKTPVTDPEAPYGWIKDPKAPGGKRPKLRPGKQAKSEPPPRERPTNRARSAPKGTTAPDGAKITADVTALVQGTWLLLAAVPESEFKIPGTKMTVSDVSVRTRAQAAILEDNGESIVRGLVMTAQHSPTVAKVIAKAGEESGPAWIIPAMMALMPFVVQSAAMWNAPAAGDVARLADRTKSELDSMLKGTQPTAEASPNGTNPDGTPVPGAEAHPYP